MVNDDRQRAIVARRTEGQSSHEFACGVGINLAVVHGEVKAAECLSGSGASSGDMVWASR